MGEPSQECKRKYLPISLLSFLPDSLSRASYAFKTSALQRSLPTCFCAGNDHAYARRYMSDTVHVQAWQDDADEVLSIIYSTADDFD